MALFDGIREVMKEPPSKDGSFDLCHVFVFFVRFADIRNGQACCLKYIARAEKMGEVFAVKFYAARDRKSEHDKYSLAHGQMGVGAVLSIFNNCLSIIIEIGNRYPDCSFVFKGAEAYDSRMHKWEDENENQRFRIYRAYLSKNVGNVTYTHFHFPENSIYLLVHNSDEDVEAKKDRLMMSLKKRYIISE